MTAAIWLQQARCEARLIPISHPWSHDHVQPSLHSDPDVDRRLLGIGIASADPGRSDDVPKIVVSLAGLDLSTPKGAELVYDRIRSAAKIVCRVDQSRELTQISRARACFRSAVSDAVGQANRPLLSALHERRMGEQAKWSGRLVVEKIPAGRDAGAMSGSTLPSRHE